MGNMIGYIYIYLNRPMFDYNFIDPHSIHLALKFADLHHRGNCGAAPAGIALQASRSAQKGP